MCARFSSEQNLVVVGQIHVRINPCIGEAGIAYWRKTVKTFLGCGARVDGWLGRAGGQQRDSAR